MTALHGSGFVVDGNDDRKAFGTAAHRRLAGAGFGGGAGRYSSITLLITAIGRPGAVKLSDAVDADDRQLLAQMLTPFFFVLGTTITIGSAPVGATAFSPPGPLPPANPVHEIGRRAELALHVEPREQRVVQREHADRRGVAVIGAVRLDLLFRVGVPVVQVERQRHRTLMRRKRDDDAAGGIAADLHVAEHDVGRGRPARAPSGQLNTAGSVIGGSGSPAPACAWPACGAGFLVVAAGGFGVPGASASTARRWQQRRAIRMMAAARISVADAGQPGRVAEPRVRGPAANQLEELHARARVVAEGAEHGAGDGEGVLLLDAAHRHAQVRALADHRHAERIDLLADGLGDLVGHPLLDLQPPREHVHEPGNLAEPDDARLRNVGDVALAEERQQVVLAQAVEIDVLHDDHLVVVDREERVVEDFVDVGRVAAGQECERLLDAQRRPQPALREPGPRPARPGAAG